MSKYFLTGLFSFLQVLQLNAQTSDHRWAVGFHAGLSEYSGDLGNNFFKFKLWPSRVYSKDKITLSEKQPGYVGLDCSRYLNSLFDVSATLDFGRQQFFRSTEQNFSVRYFSGEATLRWKFLQKDNSLITPYLTAGLGFRSAKPESPDEFNEDRQTNLVVPAGAGLLVRCEKKVYLTIQSNYGWTSGDKIEGQKKLTRFANDQLWNHRIGISYLF